MERDPLEVDPETMRLLGYQVVDWLVERAHGRRDEPVLRQASSADMARRVPGTAPASGRDLDEILRHLGEDVLPFRSRIDHPRYLAYVPGEGTWPGALGDLIASTYNIDVGNWMESAGPSRLETVVLRWFADWIGYPAESAGVLVSGGSAANLTAMACAREALVGAMSGELVAYVSEQGHSSLARAARVLGFGPQQVRVLPVDDKFRMRTDALEAAITADLAAGRRPLVVLAVAGTTNTGAVDDLAQLARVCGRYGVWLHVDGAYGAFAALTERGREALAGLELADSVTLDPHKWLYQPFECGALLVRRGHLLKDAFEIHPSYLQDTTARDGATNYADHGLQLTRMSRALKIWMSLQYFGVDAFAAAIDRAMDLAEHAQRVIEAAPDLELLAPATLGIVGLPQAPARARRRGGPRARQRHPHHRPCGERRRTRLLHPTVRPLRDPPVRAQPRHDDRPMSTGCSTGCRRRPSRTRPTRHLRRLAPRFRGPRPRTSVRGGRDRSRPTSTSSAPNHSSRTSRRIACTGSPPSGGAASSRRARRSCASGRSTGTSTCSSRVTPTSTARAAT